MGTRKITFSARVRDTFIGGFTVDSVTRFLKQSAKMPADVSVLSVKTVPISSPLDPANLIGAEAVLESASWEESYGEREQDLHEL